MAMLFACFGILVTHYVKNPCKSLNFAKYNTEIHFIAFYVSNYIFVVT